VDEGRHRVKEGGTQRPAVDYADIREGGGFAIPPPTTMSVVAAGAVLVAAHQRSPLPVVARGWCKDGRRSPGGKADPNDGDGRSFLFRQRCNDGIVPPSLPPPPQPVASRGTTLLLSLPLSANDNSGARGMTMVHQLGAALK